MKITIDLRSLSSGSISGVENYIVNLVDHLLPIDKNNRYSLFYNSWQKQDMPEFHYVNSVIKTTRIPNKILNLALKFRLAKIEKIAGDCDVFFMPNLNQYHIGAETKLALTVHDLSPVILPEFYDLKRNLWHKFLNYKRAFKRADVIFAVSQYTKNDLVKLFGINETKIKVIHPGIDHKHFNPNIPTEKLRELRNRFSLPGDFILFLNTIEPRKNLDNLIKSFELMKHDCHLVIAGRQGWKYNKIFNLINNSKKSAKIKYIGYVDEADKPALIKLAKMLVYPSLYEGFGFQALEAMAVGTPTMVSSVAALPEVTDGAALLVNPYNISEMAAGLDLLLADDKLRASFVEKGIKRAGEFSWEKTAGEVLKELNNL